MVQPRPVDCIGKFFSNSVELFLQFYTMYLNHVWFHGRLPVLNNKDKVPCSKTHNNALTLSFMNIHAKLHPL